MSAKGLWIAFGVGITAGAVVALLYAPQTGKVARRKLGKAYDEAGNYVDDAGDYLKDQAECLAKEAKKAYSTGRSQLDDAYSKATDALTDAYSTAKDKLADVADETISQVESASKKVRSLV